LRVFDEWILDWVVNQVVPTAVREKRFIMIPVKAKLQIINCKHLTGIA
jgi:hypothetical protein